MTGKNVSEISDNLMLINNAKDAGLAFIRKHSLYRHLTKVGYFPKQSDEDIVMEIFYYLVKKVEEVGLGEVNLKSYMFTGVKKRLNQHYQQFKEGRFIYLTIESDFPNEDEEGNALEDVVGILEYREKSKRDPEFEKSLFGSVFDDRVKDEKDCIMVCCYIADDKNKVKNLNCHIHEMYFFERIKQVEIHRMLDTGCTAGNVRATNHRFRQDAYEYCLGFNQDNIEEADNGLQRLQGLADSYAQRSVCA